MINEFEFEGTYAVEFTNGQAKDIYVKRNIVNGNAYPLYLVDVDNKFYNWANIISIKKLV